MASAGGEMASVSARGASGGAPFVVMVKTADLRDLDDRARGRWLRRSRDRGVWREAYLDGLGFLLRAIKSSTETSRAESV